MEHAGVVPCAVVLGAVEETFTTVDHSECIDMTKTVDERPFCDQTVCSHALSCAGSFHDLFDSPRIQPPREPPVGQLVGAAQCIHN
jgi:hypothetical protein